MPPHVDMIVPEATIWEAAEQRTHLAIGLLPVCEGEPLVGVVMARDLRVWAVAEGRDPMTTMVHEVMPPDVVYGFDDQDMQDAARLTEQYQVRRLPVFNRRQ